MKHAAARAPATSVASNAAAWSLNVSTSVLIVFVNKLLMDPKHGMGFVYATCLCSLHFFVSGLAVRLSEWLGYGVPVRLPFKDVFYFSLIAGTSVASLNLSLLVNSVGFYQISKLLIIPFVCVVEAVWFERRYTLPILASILLVITGVGVVTVTDMSMNILGFVIAMISVVSSGMQQLLCGAVQRKHGLTSTQLLSNTAPLQGMLLLLVGPSIDRLVSGQWITTYRFNPLNTEILVLSCSVAILVNISQFMCLGRFSALTFQVLGHAKTVLVLLVGWLYLHDSISARKLVGMSMAVAGMVAYGWLNAQQAAPLQKPTYSKDYSLLKEKSLSHGLSLNHSHSHSVVNVRPELVPLLSDHAADMMSTSSSAASSLSHSPVKHN